MCATVWLRLAEAHSTDLVAPSLAPSMRVGALSLFPLGVNRDRRRQRSHTSSLARILKALMTPKLQTMLANSCKFSRTSPVTYLSLHALFWATSTFAKLLYLGIYFSLVTLH